MVIVTNVMVLMAVFINKVVCWVSGHFWGKCSEICGWPSAGHVRFDSCVFGLVGVVLAPCWETWKVLPKQRRCKLSRWLVCIMKSWKSTSLSNRRKRLLNNTSFFKQLTFSRRNHPEVNNVLNVAHLAEFIPSDLQLVICLSNKLDYLAFSLGYVFFALCIDTSWINRHILTAQFFFQHQLSVIRSTCFFIYSFYEIHKYFTDRQTQALECSYCQFRPNL